MRYCINCKWCKYREFASLGVNWGWFCRLKEVTTIDSVGHKRIWFGDAACSSINIHGLCTKYKRLWYKFWIKGDE